ncbi:thermonuclease family protein [Terrihabitans sp. B22-R8]|uniref:thermonuclease family protein n=1 Tax=Terrihabitans sp. B22-R8 TaxID=3425128 RepID=UPI00403C37DE
MKPVLLAVALLAILSAGVPSAGNSAPITGRASVIDGDTIEIHGQHIRLWGVDAPEGQQTCQNAAGKAYRCGKRAADALDKLLAEARPTSCEPVDVDRYGRVVARCTAGGRDVAEALVLRGLAVDYPMFSRGAYSAAEREARSARRGLWRGSFVKPWEWRRAEHHRR